MSNHVSLWNKKQIPTGRTVTYKSPVLFADLNEPFRDMERFLDQIFTATPTVTGSDDILKFSPAMDLQESEKNFQINLEVPGVSAKDIDISITKDMLTVSGEKKEEREEVSKGLYRMERRYGSFSRSIPLPENGVDTERVHASHKDGVLTITLPKRIGYTESVKKIPIATANEGQSEGEKSQV